MEWFAAGQAWPSTNSIQPDVDVPGAIGTVAARKSFVGKETEEKKETVYQAPREQRLSDHSLCRPTPRPTSSRQTQAPGAFEVPLTPSGPCIPEFPEWSGSPQARHGRPPTAYRRTLTFLVPLERLRLGKALSERDRKEERDRIPSSPGAATVRSFSVSTNSPANLLKTNPGARRLRSSSDPVGTMYS